MTSNTQSMGPAAYAMSLVGDIGGSYQEFGKALWSDEKVVSANLKELLFCRTSIVNRCSTCLTPHLGFAKRRGIPDVEIEALSDPESWGDVFDDATRAALSLADAVAGESQSIDPALISTLQAHFTETELAELASVCGQANLNNRLGNTARQLLQWSAPDQSKDGC